MSKERMVPGDKIIIANVEAGSVFQDAGSSIYIIVEQYQGGDFALRQAISLSGYVSWFPLSVEVIYLGQLDDMVKPALRIIVKRGGQR